MVIVNHVVVGQGVGRREDQATGPVGVGAVIPYDAAIGRGGRAVDLNPSGMVVVKGGVCNQRAVGRLPNINAVIRIIRGAVIMSGDADKLIVSRARHCDAMVLGVFDFHIL